MKKKYLFVLLTSFIMVAVCALVNFTQGQEQGQANLFTVEQLVVARDVENRQPIGISGTFQATTERVYCFLEATDIKEDTTVSFHWYFGGKEIHSYDLPLKKGDRWRTFVYKNLYGQKGAWEVALKDSSGKTIETVSFIVE